VADQLKRFTRLRATAVRLSIDDLAHPGPVAEATLQRGDLRITPQGFEWRGDLTAPGLLAERVRLRAGFTGDLARPEDWRGRWSLEASGLEMGALLVRRWPDLARVKFTEARLNAAGDWQQGRPGASEVALTAQELQLDGPRVSMLRGVDVGFHYRPAAGGATLDIAPLRLTGSRGVWPTATARVEWRPDETGVGHAWSFSSEFLRLDDLAPWATALWRGAKEPHRTMLASLHGDLSGFEGRWQRDAAGPRYRLHGRFAGLGGRWPETVAAEGLDGEITADENNGRLSLHPSAAALTLPQLIEQTARFDKLGAEVQWQRNSTGWALSLPQFEWALLGSSGEGHAELRLTEGRSPELKLASDFSARDVAALKPLMPRRWGQPLKDWLERAVVRGRISGAKLAIEGPLADFPYHRNPTGRWSLRLPVSGARLEYQPDWPGVDQLSATLEFAGNGLRFSAPRGVVSGVAVTGASGQIEAFDTSPLVIDASTRGEAAAYYAFVRGSPLASRLSALVNRSEADGLTEVDVHLEVPLHHIEGQHTVARGEVRLADNVLRHEALDAPITGIQGVLRFGGGVGVAAERLEGRLRNTPITARIAPDSEGADTLSARFSVEQGEDAPLPSHYLPRWLRSRLSGRSDWQLALPLAGHKAGWVRLSSDLVGTAAALPPPLAKPADTAWPMALELHGDDTVPLALQGTVGQLIGLAMRFARPRPGALAVQSLNLRFGRGAPAWLAETGVRIDGELASADPRDWRGLLRELQSAAGSGAPGGGDALPLLEATLGIRQLQLAGFAVPEVRVTLRREYGGYAARFEGPGTLGSGKLSAKGDALSGQFTMLRLTPLPKAATATTALIEETPMDPREAPTLDLTVDALEIGERPFGRLELRSEYQGSGQVLRHASLRGGIAELEASGEWRRAGGMTEARSRFTLDSDDLAGTLESLGFAPNISGRDAHIVGDLTWPGAVRGFDWAQERGTVDLSVASGALRSVDPGGGGRVLGLFNFYALPRRLTLDFGDVVSRGLGFDRIEGQFQLADGVAHTDNLTVRGPSVRIEVHGDVGLARHDYNQVITVTPNTSGLTFGALLLGGATAVAAPVLPIIAVIANQVIDRPLAQVTQLSYGLTGSWDNPEIRKIETTPEKPEVAVPTSP
jgi:uncharacterized protein (TIGR02099 family)